MYHRVVAIRFLRRNRHQLAAPGSVEPIEAAEPSDPAPRHPAPGETKPARARIPRPTRTHLANLQSTIDAIETLVVIAHPECSLWMWNRRCEESSGIPIAEVSGKPLWSVMRLPNRLHTQAQAAFDALLSGETRSVEFDAQWLRKDGRRARTHWVARLVTEEGVPQYIVATGTDATRGTAVARALDETEDRFGKLLAVLPDPVVVHQNGKVVFANRAAMEMYGAPDPDEFIGTPVTDRVVAEDHELVHERIKTMLGQWRDVPIVEQRHIRMDGSTFEVEVIAAPVMFNGKPAIEVVVRDVSTRNEMLSALRESEARVRAVFDHSSLGMLLVNSEARVVESNAAVQRLLGYTQEQLGAMDVWAYTHPDDIEKSRNLLTELFAGRNEGYELEKRYIAADGHEIWANTHAAPIRDASGKPRLLVAMVEDVGAHKALEEQLRQASKMEALGRLASGVAHDFNNLLTVVNGYSELLAQTLEGPEREDAIKISEAGAKAKDLTSQLLTFGRRGKPTLETVDLNARIEQMMPMLGRMLGEDVAIELQLDRHIRSVQTDPSQLDQVIMNLAVNARDAMPGGGRLSLATQYLDFVPGRDVDQAWARIEIADSGIGMEPEVLEHIFEPFFTTKGKEGTGLGLAIVYGIVQQMGGQIAVESRLGYGSRFIVDLPHTEEHARRRGPGDPQVARPTQAATILVVEDEPAVRDFCKRVLEAEGYTVMAAGPREAFAAAGELGSKLDMVLTDVVMPEYDGPTIAAALRSRRQDLRILFMTGYPRNREEELTGAAARGEVLAKPFSPMDLRDAVRRVLDAEPERTPA